MKTKEIRRTLEVGGETVAVTALVMPGGPCVRVELGQLILLMLRDDAMELSEAIEYAADDARELADP